MWFPVVGDQRQVDGQPLPLAAQRLGETAGERAVELPLQDGEVGDVGVDRLAKGLLGGESAEPLTGGMERADDRGGDQKDRPEHVAGDRPLVVVQRQVRLQKRHGRPVDLLAVERTMVWAHGSLRVGSSEQNP